jgi:hypothetical protein
VISGSLAATNVTGHLWQCGSAGINKAYTERQGHLIEAEHTVYCNECRYIHSKIGALMAGPQSKRKVKKNRWTHTPALRKQKKKSVDHVDSGISSRDAQPLVRQVVRKLQEMCKAVLAVDTLKPEGANVVNMATTEAMCLLSSHKTSAVSKGNAEIPEVNSDIPYSGMCGVPASPAVLKSDNAERADSLVKLEICEIQNWKEQQNSLYYVNHPEKTDAYKVIKEECKSDVEDFDMCVNTVNSCKIQMLDNFANTSHKVEHTATKRKNIDPIESNEAPTSCAMAGDDQKGLSYQLCGKKAFSDTSSKIVLHNFSLSQYEYCKEHDGISTDLVDLENQSIVPTNKSGFDNIDFSAVGCPTDEGTRNCEVEIKELSGHQSRMGNRKHVSRNKKELLDRSVSGSMDEVESLPALKNGSSKEEIFTRNCEMVLVGGTDRLLYQEVSDSGSTRSSPDSRYAVTSETMGLSDANSYRCITPAHSWSPTVLNSGSISHHLEPSTDIPFQYGLKTSDAISESYTERLYEDVHMLQSIVPIPYPAMVPWEGTGPETETLKSQEELFRRIEESLAERETLKYQEEELLKRIERSLTETESLKCREEKLLTKIERSLTRAKSLKSREEELLRRIEVSLAQTETVKSQDEELLIRMEASLKDAKYSVVGVNSVSSMEFESEYKPEFDNSLPIKKRKTWLKRAIDDDERELQIRSLPLESFPSFPSRPMISIAELEAVGRLQQHASFPSFPSRPMISIAELEAHAAFGRSQQHAFESPATTSWIAGYHHYCGENNFCDESFCSRNINLERMYGEFLEQNVKTVGNTTIVPVCKVEDSSDDYSCSETSSACVSSQLSNCNGSYNELFRRVEASSAETSLSRYSDVAEDSKTNINLLVRFPADSLSSKAEVGSKDIVAVCERTSGPSADLYMVDTDFKGNKGTEATVTGSECNEVNFMNNNVLLEKNIPSSNVMDMDSKNCTKLPDSIEVLIESKCIKVEPDSKDSVENYGVIYSPSTDFKYKAD